jgi:hypothetical protein
VVDEIYERINTKKCYKCGLEKPVLDFTKNRCTKDGYAHICRRCKNTRIIIDPDIKDKVCKNCGLRKPLEEFHKNRGSKDGRVTICKNCFNHPWVINRNPIEKECSTCHEVKPVSEFNHDNSKPDKYRDNCRVCAKLAVIKNRNIKKVKTKHCRKCGENKPINNFRSFHGKYRVNCKECDNKIKKELNIKYSDRLSKDELISYRQSNPYKVCIKCKNKKPLSEFSRKRLFKDGLDYFCKECKRLIPTRHYREYQIYNEYLPPDLHKEWLILMNNLAREVNVRLKLDVFSHYSKNGVVKCVNPYHIHNEEITNLVLLTLDHINGDGYKEKNSEGRRFGGTNYYRKLKQKGYPIGFQVLCWNCQAYKVLINREHHRAIR